MGIKKKPKVSIGCSACNHNYDFTHLQFNFSLNYESFNRAVYLSFRQKFVRNLKTL